MDPQYKADFIQAGKIAKEARSYGVSLIKTGASYNEVIKKIRDKITELNGICAFPPQIALDDVAAHFLPQPGEDIIFKNELVKLDIGVAYNGAIGDCAVTVDLSGKYQHIIDAAEAALLAAEKAVKVGATVGEIGRAIQDEITRRSLAPIKNLSGHGLGKFKVHVSPTFPNYDNSSTTKIVPGMTIAIEPFATDGEGSIYEAGNATIFSFETARPVRSEYARSCLSKIKTFNGLPFAIHDLIDDKLSLAKAKFGIKELMQAGVLADHPPLVEIAHGMVAQAENSILIDEDGTVIVTTR